MVQFCPQPDVLQRLVAGRLDGNDAEPLESHLLECSHCQQLARTLLVDDEVMAAIRTRREFAEDSEWLRQAVGLAKRMRQTVETENTLATGAPGPVGDDDARNVDADAVPRSHADLQDAADSTPNLDFLRPPQEEGELGRLGDYRVLEVIGAGGMGIVFRAEDPLLRRQVALKVMKPAAANSRSAKDRFLREAQAAAAIEHDNIVHIYQVGEDRGIPFIAMQCLRGESLQTWLKREGRLAPEDVVQIGREVALGLAAAHARGLIHRDIKPDNIWIEAIPHGDAATNDERASSPRRVRILDFGLARAFRCDSELTGVGMVLGTPKYMAPEQARGEPVDGRCDLFSLGSVLYHMLAGCPPFDGENVTAVLLAVAQAKCQPLPTLCPNLPSALTSLVSQLLDADPRRRPQSAAEVASRLARLECELRDQHAATASGEGESGNESWTAEDLSQRGPRRSETSPRAEAATHIGTDASASSSVDRPASAPVTRLGGRRRSAAMLAATLVMAGICWLCLSLIFRMVTDDGVLTVKVQGDHGDRLAALVQGTNMVIKNARTGETVTIKLNASETSTKLPAGAYFVLETSPGLKAPKDRFTIRDGKPQRLEVTWTPHAATKPAGVVAEATPGPEGSEESRGGESPDARADQADALVAGLAPIHSNEFDQVNINLYDAGSKILRTIRDDRHFVTCPKEHPSRGRWAWPVFGVDDGVIDVTARVEPGSDPAWLVVLHSDELNQGVAFNINDTRIVVHGSIFQEQRTRERYFSFPRPPVAGQFHRLQVALDGEHRQVTPYIDGVRLCPPIDLEFDLTPCTLSLGIAHSRHGEAGEVSFERYAVYSLRTDVESRRPSTSGPADDVGDPGVSKSR
ncbi:MAG: serine/threonine protein kinase [Planctomycetales bacterium]|nr:serine/threonine protein kinase [Planctomycetales bacterium]